jgi:hypothetical protein
VERSTIKKSSDTEGIFLLKSYPQVVSPLLNNHPVGLARTSLGEKERERTKISSLSLGPRAKRGRAQSVVKRGEGQMTKEEGRRLKNEAETQFLDYAVQKGIFATRRGWPDFACFLPDGELIAVEIKRNSRHCLKESQLRIMRALSKFGVPCYRWTPDGGFERVKGGGNGKG